MKEEDVKNKLIDFIKNDDSIPKKYKSNSAIGRILKIHHATVKKNYDKYLHSNPRKINKVPTKLEFYQSSLHEIDMIVYSKIDDLYDKKLIDHIMKLALQIGFANWKYILGNEVEKKIKNEC